MASRKLEVQIVGDASSLQRAFGQAASSSSSFGSKLAKVGKIAAVGLAAGVGVATVAAVKFAQAALDAEKSQTRLDAAFKHAGASAKQQAAAMQRVSQVSNQAGLDDEDLADSLARLTQVTGDVTKAQNLMALSADVARGRGMELSAATMLIAKASLGNVGALKRMGIAIPAVTAAQDALKASTKNATAEQKAAAKAADLTATKQAAIAALQAKFGGDAEAYGKTASGAMDRFKVAVENVQEGLGAALLPTLGRVAGGLADFLTKFNDARTAGDKLRVVLDSVKKLGSDAWAALRAGFAAINWGSIWDSVKARLAAVDWAATARAVGDSLVRAMASLSAAMQRVDWNRVGAAIGDGIKKAVGALANVNWGALIVGVMRLNASLLEAVGRVLVSLGASLLSGLRGVLSQAASAAGAAASRIGSQIVQGVLGGLGSLWGLLKAKIEGILGGVLRSINIPGFSPPEHAAAQAIGIPLAQGTIRGWVIGTAELPAKLSETVRNAIEAARRTVEARRSSLADTWSTLAGDATSAFDAIYGNIQTKSEKALAKLQLTQQKAQLAEGISTARTALADARAGTDGVVDQAAVVAAQKQLDAALLAQREFVLQQQAAKERLELDASIARKRRHFETSLALLQTSLVREGASQDDAQRRIIALFNRYGVDYKKAGAALGNAFAAGMDEALDAVAAAAQRLAAAAASKVSVKVSGKVDGKRAMGGPVSAGSTYLVGERGPELFTAARSGRIIPNGGGSAAASGGTVVNVTVNGWVGSDQQIAQRVQQELIRYGRSATSIFSGPGVTV